MIRNFDGGHRSRGCIIHERHVCACGATRLITGVSALTVTCVCMRSKIHVMNSRSLLYLAHSSTADGLILTMVNHCVIIESRSD